MVAVLQCIESIMQVLECIADRVQLSRRGCFMSLGCPPHQAALASVIAQSGLGLNVGAGCSTLGASSNLNPWAAQHGMLCCAVRCAGMGALWVNRCICGIAM